MLTEERQYYDDHLPELLEHHAERVLLIRGSELVGTFDDEESALAEGARRFGLESHLIRRVRAVQEEIHVPALTLGILQSKMPPTHVETD